MIAYNKDWLYNLFVRQQTDELFDNNIIDETEKKSIYDYYKVAFYSPNIFIRIGLFILTLIILIFTFGLLSLIFLSVIDKTYIGMFIFFGLLAYVALEIIIKNKKHFQSGVDDALLWSSVGLIFSGILFLIDFVPLGSCVIACLITFYCTIRFADKLMAIAAFITVIGIFFFGGNKLGPIAQAIMPFILMVVSAIIYFLSKNKQKEGHFNVYGGCFMMLEIISLLAFYCFGNYWAVQYLSDMMNDVDTTQVIHFSWLFWLFTICAPLIYISIGIQKKDVILLRVGLLLIAAMVFTIRYYHSIMPLETAMTIGGILLIGIGWALTRYLQTPKFGFTYQELKAKHAMDIIKIESLIIAETFSHPTQPLTDFEFGGGTGGGGGAGGEF